MKKQNLLAILTVFSLLVTAPGISRAAAPDTDASKIHTFHRVITSENDGLIRYHTIDEDGKELAAPTGAGNVSVKRASSLPVSYSSVSANVITPIKNQGVTGCCWAFGALKSLEASSIIKGLTTLENTDYSENHLAWYTYHTLTDTSHPLYGDTLSSGEETDAEIYDHGGNALFAIFSLANWWGAVSEDKAPFTATTQAEAETMAASMNEKPDSFRFASDVHLREANCYDTASLSDIKQAVIEHGSLDVSFYYNPSNQYNGNGVSSYYQTMRNSDYANHCVSIVGWNDNFNTFNRPTLKKGAWLIANSYGEESGTDGYFWLSYYDSSICEIYSFEAEATDTYDTNFQYDGAGWSNGYYSEDNISMANLFTNGEDAARQIEAVSFYTYADYQKYQIQVYRNITGNGPLDGEPISSCSVTGTATRNGYHTIPLKESFAVAPGERFSIVVTFLPSSQTDNLAYALMEGTTDASNSIYYNSQPGQSFIYFAEDDIWYDNTAFQEEGTITNNNNVCVKAFANTITDEEFQEIEKNYVPETLPPTKSPTASPVSDHATTPPGTSMGTQNPDATISPDSGFATNQPAPIGGQTAVPPTTSSTPNSSQTGSPITTGLPITSAVPKASSTPQTSDTNLSGSKVKITLKKSRLVIGKGETVTLPITVSPSSSKKQLKYASSNEKVVIVSNSGKIVGLKTGTAKITVSAPSGVKKRLTIQVKKAPASLRITSPKKMSKSKTATLKIKLSKKSASYQLVYRSLTPKTASVTSQGKIKARKKGTAIIQVTTFNKKKGRIKIQIT